MDYPEWRFQEWKSYYPLITGTRSNGERKERPYDTVRWVLCRYTEGRAPLGYAHEYGGGTKRLKLYLD
jgi:hypothetical protein